MKRGNRFVIQDFKGSTKMLRECFALVVMNVVLLQGFIFSAPSGRAAEALQSSSDSPPARVLLDHQDAEFAPGEVLVKYKASIHSLAMSEMEQKTQLMLLSHNDSIGVYHYEIHSTKNVLDVVAELSNDPLIEFAQPNYYYHLDIVPDDPFYANFRSEDGSLYPNSLQRWIYNGIGANKNINGEAAWELTTGRPDVVIAVIDSGILLNHPDLAPNIWRNPGEIPGNGIDDDGNGFVDDVNGWDFRGNVHKGRSQPDNDPNPDLGDGLDDDNSKGPDDNTFHGTFVAGVVGAPGNDGKGVAGVCWHCQLMALKVFTDDGFATDADIADAVTYAANHGAAVINMSLNGSAPSPVQRRAVNFAHAQGVVIVAAAGNENSSKVRFPAGFEHVIAAGASDYAGDFPFTVNGQPVIPDINGRASFSEFGPGAVDVVAPGYAYGTTVLSVADQQLGMGRAGDAQYRFGRGTSFSTPLIAGLAALMISRTKDLGLSISNDQVEDIIQNTAVDLPDDPDDDPNAGSNWDGHGRINMRAALNAVASQLRAGARPTPDPNHRTIGQTPRQIEVSSSTFPQAPLLTRSATR